jgi:hypothetical protein
MLKAVHFKNPMTSKVGYIGGNADPQDVNNFKNAKNYGYNFLNVKYPEADNDMPSLNQYNYNDNQDEETLVAASASEKTNFLYTVVEAPKFGKLQFRLKNFYEDLTGPFAHMNTFTQQDIDQGILYCGFIIVYCVLRLY